MICFREIIENDAEILLKWRTDPKISDVMLTDIDNNIDRQCEWIINSRLRNDYYHWIVCVDDKDVGWISLAAENSSDGKIYATMGFYIGDKDYSHITYALLSQFYSNIFSLGFNDIIIWVLEGNSVIRIHKLFGFLPYNKLNKDIIKNGVSRTFIAYKLTADSYASSNNRVISFNLPTKLRKFKNIFCA